MHQRAAGLAQPLLHVDAAVAELSCEAELCSGHASCSKRPEEMVLPVAWFVYLSVDYFLFKEKLLRCSKVTSPQCAVRT